MRGTEAVFTSGTPEVKTETYPPAVGSKRQMFILFILNERSGELMGEFHRWMDLARTETLVLRAQTFNPEAAANIRETHIYRPLPQEYIDGDTINGENLTPAQRDQLQNPGY